MSLVQIHADSTAPVVVPGAIPVAPPGIAAPTAPMLTPSPAAATTNVVPAPVVKLSAEDAAKIEFKAGVDAYNQKRYDLGAAHLAKIGDGLGYLSLYKHWYLGQNELERAKFAEAEQEFNKILKDKSATSEMRYQAQFLLGETSLRQKKFKDAISRLQPLERKWRHSYRYPEVLYRLMTADLRLGHTANVCKRARKLYAKFPGHPLVLAWGFDLTQDKVEGKNLPCTASREDFNDRVHSLQWAGESEKAHQELITRIDKIPADERLSLDLTLAGFLVNEGSVDDALNLLIRYYPQQKSSLPYLSLLGKAAARSGEYQTAVGAYERAFELNPKSKKGREALFQAAYLSYQFQDYDGAVRKFQQFVKANPRSGLTKDARWHLAWLQYLRGDYRGALEKFAAAAKDPGSRRKTNDGLRERLAYWSGMAHIRLNEMPEAQAAFESITAKTLYSYYAIAAQARMNTIKAKLDLSKPRVPASQLVGQSEAPASEVPEEQESEEDISAADSIKASAQATADDAEDEEPEEKIEASTFKDPAMRAHIDIAQNLIALGLFDLARWELFEVERHTRNQQYLRSLISAYDSIGSFNRSSSIAELSFGKDREAAGLEGARPLWTAMFPQAFKQTVQLNAKRFSLPQEWTWAIMRTESLYKPDVISPVGARGLMQLMPLTARNLYKLSGEMLPEDFNLLNPDTNIRLGTQYLARLGGKFNSQLPLVAAAYNAGPHRVEGWLVSFGHLDTDEFIEHIPYMETRNYVKRVIRNQTLYRRLYAKDNRSAEYLGKALNVTIPARASTRESWDSI